MACLLGAPPVIAPEEIRHRDDKHDSECTFNCNVKWWSSCRSRPVSRVNKARVDRDKNVYSIIFVSLSLTFSIGLITYTRVCTRAYVALRTYARLRTAVYARGLFTIGWQPDDHALLGASDEQQSASRSNQSVAGSSAETVIRWFW